MYMLVIYYFIHFDNSLAKRTGLRAIMTDKE